MSNYELKNWWFEVGYGEARKKILAMGYVYNNKRFRDGQEIHTSWVQEITKQDDILILKTKNSVYHCLLGEHCDDTSDLDKVAVKERLSHLGDIEKLKKEMSKAREAKRKREEEGLKKLIPEEQDNVLIMEFSSEKPDYFKTMLAKRNGVIRYLTDYTVHVGMVRDSVLIGDSLDDLDIPLNERIDYRFFPMFYDTLEFYQWYKFGGVVYGKNSGNSKLTLDTPAGRFVIPPGACYPLMPYSSVGRVEKEKVEEVE